MDGNAQEAPTQAPAGPRRAEIKFYVPASEPEGHFDIFTVQVGETTSLGAVLKALLGAPGDLFVYGVFLTEAITSDLRADPCIEASRFYGCCSHSILTRFDPDKLIMPLIDCYSQHVLIVR